MTDSLPSRGRVFNLRDKGAIPAEAVLIDRTTKWGNPFRIPEDGNRQMVIARYEEHLTAKMAADSDFWMDVAMLNGKDVVCWCAPKACHGDILLREAYKASYELRLTQ